MSCCRRVVFSIATTAKSSSEKGGESQPQEDAYGQEKPTK